MKKVKDGSFVSDLGEVIYYSQSRYESEIVGSDNCFICGASRGSTKFSDEHILPDWLLKEFDLYNSSINLPNRRTHRYSTYKIPCCTDCNKRMGDHFEKPISEAIKSGYEGVLDFIKKNGSDRIFQWLALIFFKSHYKDQKLWFFKNKQDGDDKIGDFYDWIELHHIHCIARLFYTNAKTDDSVSGTLFVFPAKQLESVESFDYADLYESRSIMIRLNDTCLLAVLNDSGLAGYHFMKTLPGPIGMLSAVQLREVFARISHLNNIIIDRPQFFSANVDGAYSIVAKVPKVLTLKKGAQAEYGELLHGLTISLLDSLVDECRNQIIEKVRQGQWTFLFFDNGEFDTESMNPIVE